jgi:hypothetical protein
VQLGLFLGCVRCHSSAELFFFLNFFVVESRCEVFGLEDLADLYTQRSAEGESGPTAGIEATIAVSQKSLAEISRIKAEASERVAA